jgi:hypothetical protein
VENNERFDFGVMKRKKKKAKFELTVFSSPFLHRWRFRMEVILEWNALLFGLSNNVIRVLYGPTGTLPPFFLFLIVCWRVGRGNGGGGDQHVILFLFFF